MPPQQRFSPQEVIDAAFQVSPQTGLARLFGQDNRQRNQVIDAAHLRLFQWVVIRGRHKVSLTGDRPAGFT
jgi:hypothetical protein